MKKFVRIIFILTALLLCVGTLVACNKEIAENETEPATEEIKGTSAPTEKPTQALEAPDSTKFNIYFNKEYLCAFVIPENATEDETQVAEAFKSALSGHTGKMMELISDAQSTDGYERVVLIGNTKYQESKDAYAALSEREAVAAVKDDKLVIAFSSLSSGKGIVKSMTEVISECKRTQANLPLDYNETYLALPEIDALPKFDNADQTVDCGQSTNMLYFKNALLSDFNNYCSQIEDAEFEKISSREEKGNEFATFVGENEYIYVYYTAFNETIRIITGPIGSLAREDYTSGLYENKDPYIASIPQPSSGQGYIFRLPDGRFIIQDGGYKADDRVYKALRNLVPDGEITIAAWFISHPHGDHYPAFIDFIKDHSYDKSITVERLIHNYVNYEMYNITGSAGKEENGDDVLALYEAVEKYMPELPVIKAHTGQIMNFGPATVEVLYTIEDLLPSKITNINDSSMVIRLNMAGNSIMILADTCYASGPILHNMWGDHLKSDIVQMAHHSMWPSVESIYHDIQAEVILHSTMYSGLKDFIKPTQKWAKVMEVAFSYAKDMHVSDSRGEVIMLPYEIQNNKEEMLEYIKNY